MEAPQPAQDEESVLQGRDLQAIFRIWEEKQGSFGFNPVPILTRFSEIFEEEIDIYMRKDPDPFDERHPSRLDPECEFGRSLKLLFRKDHFMTKLVNDYLRDNYFTRQTIQKSSLELNIASCRLILLIMPGLEISAVFQEDYESLMHRLYNWAENSEEPLRSYATGLIAASMEVQDIAISYREQNTRLVPIMLRRLHALQHDRWSNGSIVNNTNTVVPSKDLCKENMVIEKNETDKNNSTPATTTMGNRPFAHLGGGSAPNSPEMKILQANGLAKFKSTIHLNTLIHNEGSQGFDSISPYVNSNRISLHPPTPATYEMLILRYLTSMGEYQEFLGQVFELNAMQIIFQYIKYNEPRNKYLTLDALKYLASLLCHKKFALEFISNSGLERLMKLPKPSAGTGVSIALYYLAYVEDAMERICVMSHKLVAEVVTYALWLLGCPHDSGRCHATMFFGLVFQFKVMLNEFDSQDGLRKLFNVISVLPILTVDNYNLNDDEECAYRQLVRQVCIALKKYMESHLYFKYIQSSRINNLPNCLTQISFRAAKNTPENISDQVRTLQELLPIRSRWEPVEELLTLNGITLLLRIIAYSYEWNYGGSIKAKLNGIRGIPKNARAETVRSALDVLSICCVIPKVHLVFCDRLDLPSQGSAAGINIILGAAEGEIVADAEVQKSALAILVHCVCAPISRPIAVGRYGLSRKKTSSKYSEELLMKLWESVRSNNGIIVLLQLMQIKTPITDADCLRGMACRALAGLARSETVRQIISKLPLFTSGQLQSLMRDPILQEKRTEHVQFQKYALELMERLSGRTKTSTQLDSSLANIHKANVVAQTKIQFKEQQLNELIYNHLMTRGFLTTAASLQKETGVVAPPTQTAIKPILHHHSPFSPFRSPTTNLLPRSRLRAMKPIDFNTLNNIDGQLQSSAATSTTTTPPTPTTPTVVTPTALSSPTSSLNAISSNHNNSMSTNNNNTVDDFNSLNSNINYPIRLIKRSSANITNSPISYAYQQIQQQHSQQYPQQSQQQTQQQLQYQQQQQQRCLQKQISSIEPININNRYTTTINEQPAITNITLDTIITEYLTNQHALCKNPMSTCPQFDLFIPHKCPDPRPNKISGLSLNFAGRFIKRQRGFSSRLLDRHLVHSQFCVARSIRPQDADYFFTCCDFTPCGTCITVGAYNGEVKIYNINESGEEYSNHCHESYVNNIKYNKDGTLLVTSCAWRSPLSALWNIENKQFSIKLQFENEDYMEFNNGTQDRILGTTAEVATVYDLTTGKKTSTFKPTISNQYAKNRATFCPTDELILSDGVLWDVRCVKEIHKLDKLNQNLSGVFHPNGLEIVSNTEVWDLRTFHLLRTVPALEQCQVLFSPQNVIYGICPELESRLVYENTSNTYETSFKTLDSYDYSSIATVDVKKNIYDLSVNNFGSQIGVVENQGGYDSVQESVIRIYSVGRKKNIEDEADEDDDDMDASDDSSVSDDTYVFRDEGPGRRNPVPRSDDNDSDNDNWTLPSSSSASVLTLQFSDMSNTDSDSSNDNDNDNRNNNDGNNANNDDMVYEHINEYNDNDNDNDEEDDDDEDDDDVMSGNNNNNNDNNINNNDNNNSENDSD